MEGINTNAAVSDRVINILLKLGKEKYFDKGTFVFNEGDESDYVYIILEGNADVLVTDKKGSMNIINTLAKGAVFGEMGIFLKKRRSASIRATSDIRAVSFTYKEFIETISKIPAFNVGVINILVHRLHESNKKLAELKNCKSFISVLVYLSTAEYGDTGINFSSSEVCDKIKVMPGDLMKILLSLEKENVIKDLDVDNPEKIKLKVVKNKIKEYLQDVASTAV